MIQVKEIGYAGHFFDALRFDVHAMPHLEASESVQEPNNTISFAGKKKKKKSDQNEGELYVYTLKMLGRCH